MYLFIYFLGHSSSDPTHPDYVPSVFKHRPGEEDRNKRKMSRYSSAKRRKVPLEEHSSEDVLATRMFDTVTDDAGDEDLAEPSVPSTSETDMLHQEVTNLRAEKAELQSTIDTLEQKQFLAKFDPLYIQNDDKKSKFYTGLDWYTFNRVCEYLCPTLKQTKNNLPLANQLLMTLVKLRLAFPFEHLANTTGLARSTVNDTFWKWIELMYAKLDFLIRWPDREVILPTIPPVFKAHFPRLTSIIDCFEIFIDRPKNLKARAQVYSNYKKHSTVKFLLVCSPLGAVTFLSRAWGGRASDVEIVRQSGFINAQLHYPRDQILADRGFTLQDDFAAGCGAELIIPAFTKGRKQLSAREVETTRAIASVRIHVERVIGVLKNRYKILQGPLPIRLVKSPHEEKSDRAEEGLCSIDKIVRVCASLINLSPGIVYTE